MIGTKLGNSAELAAELNGGNFPTRSLSQGTKVTDCASRIPLSH